MTKDTLAKKWVVRYCRAWPVQVILGNGDATEYRANLATEDSLTPGTSWQGVRVTFYAKPRDGMGRLRREILDAGPLTTQQVLDRLERMP